MPKYTWSNMDDYDIEKLNKMLMNAYNYLCRAEKLLKKGSDKDGKRTEPSTNYDNATSKRIARKECREKKTKYCGEKNIKRRTISTTG